MKKSIILAAWLALLRNIQYSTQMLCQVSLENNNNSNGLDFTQSSGALKIVILMTPPCVYNRPVLSNDLVERAKLFKPAISLFVESVMVPLKVCCQCLRLTILDSLHSRI